MAGAQSIDVGAWFKRGADQFKGLNPNDPGQWPLLPKASAFIFVAILVVVLAYVFLLSDVQTELDNEIARQPTLQESYKTKLALAVNLPELRKQKSQVEEYVGQLEKQLPGKAEMEDLLSEINQAAVGRGLQFELFSPGSEVVKDYYAELPISLKISGRYHDFGALAADVSNLSRIVTLHNIQIGQAGVTPGASAGLLSLEALARTYRYLDPAEVAEQQRLAKAAKQGAKK